MLFLIQSIFATTSRPLFQQTGLNSHHPHGSCDAGNDVEGLPTRDEAGHSTNERKRQEEPYVMLRRVDSARPSCSESAGRIRSSDARHQRSFSGLEQLPDALVSRPDNALGLSARGPRTQRYLRARTWLMRRRPPDSGHGRRQRSVMLPNLCP